MNINTYASGMKLKVSKKKKAVKQTRSKGRLNRPEDSDGIPVREILSYGTRKETNEMENVPRCFLS